MEIKFIQDYKNYHKGNIIKVGNISGNNLIKKGIAEKIVYFPIKKLFVCEIGLYNSTKLNGFCSKQKYGIFTYQGRYGMFSGFDSYKHIATKVDMKAYSFYVTDMIEVKDKDLIVNNPKPLYKVIFKQMQEKGWDLNTKLTIEEIKEIENKLNCKHNVQEVVK